MKDRRLFRDTEERKNRTGGYKNEGKNERRWEVRIKEEKRDKAKLKDKKVVRKREKWKKKLGLKDGKMEGGKREKGGR